MLIIGGLVVVGLIALIGAVLLALGEGRSTNAAAQAATQAIPATPQVSASAPQAEAQQIKDSESTPEAHGVRTEPILEAQPPMYSSGQFHEVVAQLQEMHEQSKDLQARLGQLSEIVEHMEQRESDMLELPRARRVS